MTASTNAAAPGPTLIGSVRRAMLLLEAIASYGNGVPAKRLARETGLPIATTYHLLRTLIHDGYLRREGGRYVIGEGVTRLGDAAERRSGRADLDDWLGTLRDELGAAVYFATYEDGEVNLVARAEGPRTPGVEQWADFRRTAHAHAVGQCLLAQLDREARRDHLARHPVEHLTPYTYREESTLLRRLSALRRGAPVLERRQYAAGTVCAAVPITVGTVPAAVALSLPAHLDHLLEHRSSLLQRHAESTLTTLAFSVRSTGQSGSQSQSQGLG
ncbi:IclR family transcriptional regulator [Streptomyces sp. NPDC050658]|uniref:IclR family transcriptional regulator n=1 Tax=unclassified Streptomyces TaxID=2593676 RepID=UPI00343E9871